MAAQSYKNHIRFYPIHHFVFYPLVTIFLIISIVQIFKSDDSLIWMAISAIWIVILFLSLLLRQHYSLVLQDRIIRLELKYRYFTLTGKKIESFGDELNDSQLFALRFCSDEELLNLTYRARSENLTGDKIKKAIRNWKPDNHRV